MPEIKSIKVQRKKLSDKVNKKEYIDPVYEIYNKKLIEELEGQEFWEFFNDNIRKYERSFEFSNRKLEKYVDERWVLAVEACMDAFKNIIDNPRIFIKEEEEIVNVAVAKQSTPDVIRHLTTHGNYIDEISNDNVRPNHLLNKFKEDTWNTYENRFVYTLLEKTIDFVHVRYEAIFAAMGDEFGSFLKVNAQSKTRSDIMKINLDIRVKQNEEENLSDDENSKSIYKRINDLEQMLGYYNTTKFSKQLRKFPRVKNPIVKTNAIQKNPNFKACYNLWVFLHNYHDIGYKINILEQDNTINENFEMDIYHSIFFNYMILKNYLADTADRKIDLNRDYKKKEIKPRFIKKIVEEIVKNYDAEATEVRKVLIEELTKQELLEISEKEREKLAAEKARSDAAARRANSKINSNKQKIAQLERAKKIRQAKEDEEKRILAEKEHKKRVESCIQMYKYELSRFHEQRSKLLLSKLGDDQ